MTARDTDRTSVAEGDRIPSATGSTHDEGRIRLIAELARRSAGETRLEDLLDVAVQRVAALLDHEYCKVLELLSDEPAVKLVAGVGWHEGLVGVATVGIGQDSQAGYTLHADGPVVVTDLRTEKRFWGPPLLRDHQVVSGISAIIPGREGPWGVLGVHSTKRHAYAPEDVVLVEAVAGVIGSAIERDRIEREARRSRHDTERALRREEARSRELRGIIAALGDGVIVYDELDRLLLMNEAAEGILGDREAGTLADLGAILDLRLLGDDDHELVERPLAGTSRWVELSTFRVGATESARRTHENRASTIVVIRDVTDVRAASEAREAFVGMLSHELRTPVTTIYAGAELLARDVGAAEREGIVTDIRLEADRLRRMVENLLVLSRVERSVLGAALEPISLAHLLPTVVEAEQRHWPWHPMRLDLAPDVPVVRGDPTYVEQVLRNLLANAAKFSPADSPIDVALAADDAGAAITVRDRGPGFEPGDAAGLFGLYFRTAAAANVPGSGIGLFVSRKLVELMDGSIDGRTLAEGGAEFRFTLPPYVE